MARDMDLNALGKAKLDFRDGTPVEAREPRSCEGATCERPTSHPSGKCSECRDE